MLAPAPSLSRYVFDAGSARIIAGLGFETVATLSGGLAATDLPPSADLDHGFGDAPEVVAETECWAAQACLVGCTIEDATKKKDQPICPLTQHSKGFQPLLRQRDLSTLTSNLRDSARIFSAENRCNRADSTKSPRTRLRMRRLRSGIATINSSVGIPEKSFYVADPEAAMVRRISLATSLYRVAIGAMVTAAESSLPRHLRICRNQAADVPSC